MPEPDISREIFSCRSLAPSEVPRPVRPEESPALALWYPHAQSGTAAWEGGATSPNMHRLRTQLGEYSAEYRDIPTQGQLLDQQEVKSMTSPKHEPDEPRRAFLEILGAALEITAALDHLPPNKSPFHKPLKDADRAYGFLRFTWLPAKEELLSAGWVRDMILRENKVAFRRLHGAGGDLGSLAMAQAASGEARERKRKTAFKAVGLLWESLAKHCSLVAGGTSLSEGDIGQLRTIEESAYKAVSAFSPHLLLSKDLLPIFVAHPEVEEGPRDRLCEFLLDYMEVRWEPILRSREALESARREDPNRSQRKLKIEALGFALLRVLPKWEEPKTRTPEEYLQALCLATIKAAESDLTKPLRRLGADSPEVSGKLIVMLEDQEEKLDRVRQEAEMRLLAEKLARNAGLSEEQERIFFLVGLKGCRPADAAKVMGISLGAARGLLHRARKKLKETA